MLALQKQMPEDQAGNIQAVRLWACDEFVS